MVNARTVTLAMVLVLMLMAGFLTASSAHALILSSEAAELPAAQSNSANRPSGPAPSFHSPADECYDVSLWELAACRKAIMTPTRYYRFPPHECYDVSLMELANCRKALRTPARYDRSPPDECYDVALLEYAGCRKSLRVSMR